MTRARAIFLGVIIAAGVAASLLIDQLGRRRALENDALLRHQESQLTQMALENRRLSNLVAEAKSAKSREDDRLAEVARLRAEAESLRQKASQRNREVPGPHRLSGAQVFSTSDSSVRDHNDVGVRRMGGGRVGDAITLAQAMRLYAKDHEGKFPSSLEDVSPYLPKDSSDSQSWYHPLTGTNEFELVFQGSLTDLTNIPPHRVALIRERQPWPTADGKFGRVYGCADGAATTVISDDNFQSWDAQHIIPPQ
jgi:hypothetical protein